MQRVTLKTSTIFIAKGDTTKVYNSLAEVPQALRKELEESTNGFNSATILIADRRGREEVRRALKGMPSALRTRFAPSLEALPPATAPSAPVEEPLYSQELSRLSRSADWMRAHWMQVAVPFGIGLITWAVLNLR